MVLLAVADHKYRIEVGYGLEGILPDGKTGDIGRDMVPDLKAGDYDGAVTTAVGEMAQVIADDAHVTLDNAPAPVPAAEPEQQEQPSAGKVVEGILITIVIIFLYSPRSGQLWPVRPVGPGSPWGAGDAAVPEAFGSGGGGLAVAEGASEVLAAAVVVLAAVAPEEAGSSASASSC